MNEGQKIYDIAKEIFPICRSITGDGVRRTLHILKKYYNGMVIKEIPSGTKVFDWNVPKEWNIEDAYIENSAGQKVIDFKKNNLHVMGYSTPVDKYVDLTTLKKFVYTEAEQPEVIPYVTSYYKERFGFCMSENQKNALPEDTYHMVIKSELKDGFLTYGEIVIPGETDQEIFLSTYVCHPSMGNNECSGPALAISLADWISKLEKRKYTYRIIFIPETIGSITYLSENKDYLKEHVIAGFNLSCVGDDNQFSMVESRYGNTLADRVLKNVLGYYAENFKQYSYLKRGSDERQYNAPGIDLPVVSYCRTKYGEYKEYHTSADDMSYISPQGFQGSFDVMTQVIMALEKNKKYCIKVLCEPQLGKRGLYPTVSKKGSYDKVYSMTNFIAYADGTNDLIEISNIIGCPIRELIDVVNLLLKNDLIEIR